MTFTAALTLMCVLAAGYQQMPELTTWIDVLGSDVPAVTKSEASRELVRAGKAAIPLLIRSLRDPRVYERRDIANRMNLPSTAPPPEPLIAKITVGERCRDLLYEIITPKHASPFAGNFKVYSEQVLQVDDWDAWWVANEPKSLAQIHAELQPLVDEYWKQHGTTQTVETPEWEQGFPIPRAARRNDSLGGATSLGPGRNYTLRVYEVDSPLEAITAFYERHLPAARRASEGQEVKLSTPIGYVKLARFAQGTRITLASGPH